MAGRGPAPKQQRARSRATPERTNLADPHRPLQLVVSGSKLGPNLPSGRAVLPEGSDWHPLTKKWWEHWRTSPQASRMLSDPDWDFLLDTALMHHIMWTKGRWEFASEIRIRVAKFGATVEDRLRLKAEIEVPEQTPAGTGQGATITSLDARRAALEE